MNKLLLFLSTCFLLASCGPPRAEQTLVLFVGDSLTQGDQTHGFPYPAQTIELLNRHHKGRYAMAVRAYPGKTAHWLLKNRLGALDSVDDTGYQRKIATIFLAANDLVYPTAGSSATPDSVLRYNRQLANILTAKGYEVLLCPGLDRANYPEFADFNQKRERYNNLLRQQYKSFAVGLVPLESQPLVFAPGATKNLAYFAQGQKPGQSDGSHPNKAGAALLAQEFAHAIQAISAK